MEEMREKIRNTDLGRRAGIIGAGFDGRWLTLKILGKDFRIDQNGKISTAIHVNPWILVPVLSFVL
ncbi:MAG: Fe-S cluster protein, partial [Desulfamplus sp.]|nr:Fe-S cluster protein [Desulfamplus sp.]